MVTAADRLKTNGDSPIHVTSWSHSSFRGGGVLGWVTSHIVLLLSLSLVIAISAAIGLGVTANSLRAQIANSPAPSATPGPALVATAANWTGFTASPFAGTVTFSQSADSKVVTVSVALIGLSPGAHGFHIHDLRDLSSGCGTAGHFNPLGVAHAFPAAPVSHAGDGGNIFADEAGSAVASYVTSGITLVAGQQTSITGLALIVHANADDGVSQPTGNAGARLGCSLITTPARAVASVWAGGTAPSADFSGAVTFTQPAGSAVVTVSVALTGLPPGLHGLHVHDMTTASQGCGTAGHLNPFARPHSYPSNVTRHVGDLGNIVVDAQGVATATFTDSVISLNAGSPARITGYVLMVHSGVDDGTTQPTGGAGARLGCSVIVPA